MDVSFYAFSMISKSVRYTQLNVLYRHNASVFCFLVDWRCSLLWDNCHKFVDHKSTNANVRTLLDCFHLKIITRYDLIWM